MTARRPTEAEVRERIRAAGERIARNGRAGKVLADVAPVSSTPAPPAGAAPPPAPFHDREPGEDDDA